MLRTNRFFAALTAVALLGWAGCTIENVDNGGTSGTTGATSGAGGDASTTTSTTTSSTGEGGGATTTTTTSGSGGGATCVGEEGTGDTVASCDTMNITPASHGGAATSNCNPNGGTDGTDDPWGYGTCIKAFEIYTAGSAENMQKCLALISISPAEACDIQNVVDCVNKVYDDACESQKASDACDAFGAICGADPLDLPACKDDMKPFGDVGIQQWADCINADNVNPCQQVHDTCFQFVNGG